MSAQPLSMKEQELVTEVILRRAPELQSALEDLVNGIPVPEEKCEAIRGAVGDELLEFGVDHDLGAVNERGKGLDALIDRVAALGRGAG